MSRAVQEGCIASCVQCSLLTDRTHKSYLIVVIMGKWSDDSAC